MSTTAPRALIAEDEPLLAAALRHELAQAWPALQVVASVGDGRTAVREALALRPEVLFFDIRMPGQSGLDAAAELADAWPAGQPFPALVFVTAYDQYAVQAFEAQAVDYLLKPVQAARLARTVARVRQALAGRTAQGGAFEEAMLARLRGVLETLAPVGVSSAGSPLSPGGPSSADGTPPAARLPVIPAGIAGTQGAVVRMVPIEEVLCFEAADKYVRVLTAGEEYLIRTPLRQLLPQLDGEDFWQVHRGTLVRASAIDAVTRDESGRLGLTLHGRPERFVVSRLYAHRFRAM